MSYLHKRWMWKSVLCVTTKFKSVSVSVDPTEQLLSYESVFWGAQSQSLLQQVCPGNVTHTGNTHVTHCLQFLQYTVCIYEWTSYWYFFVLDGINRTQTCCSGEQQESGPGKERGANRWPAQGEFSICISLFWVLMKNMSGGCLFMISWFLNTQPQPAVLL